MTPLTEKQVQELKFGDKLICVHMEESYTYKLEVGKAAKTNIIMR